MNWPENGKEIILKKEETLTFKYRVLVHGGDQAEAKIAEAFKEYINSK